MYIIYYIVNQDVRQSYKRIKLSNFSVENIKIRNIRLKSYTFSQPYHYNTIENCIIELDIKKHSKNLLY